MIAMSWVFSRIIRLPYSTASPLQRQQHRGQICPKLLIRDDAKPIMAFISAVLDDCLRKLPEIASTLNSFFTASSPFFCTAVCQSVSERTASFVSSRR